MDRSGPDKIPSGKIGDVRYRKNPYFVEQEQGI
jgi:hypothetical protein